MDTNKNLQICKNKHKSKHKNKVARSINDFIITRHLGSGGFSNVKLGYHKKNKNYYAIKCMNKIHNSKDMVKWIYHEKKILRSLNHDNIIRLLDTFEDDDKIYFVLEFLNGCDLGKFFDSKIREESIIKKIVIQVLLAIQYCHKNSIIHRDIKISNILIDKDYNIKLTDFGLSSIKKHPLDLFYNNVGTVHFSPPELLNRAGCDERSDIWSFGITIYVLLVGKYPFDGKNDSTIFHKIKHHDINYDPKLTSDQKDFLEKILHKDPNKRATIDELFNHPWLNNDTF